MKKVLEEIKRKIRANGNAWAMVAIVGLVPNLAMADEGFDEANEPPAAEEVLPADWCTSFDGICDEPCYDWESGELFKDDDCHFPEGTAEEPEMGDGLDGEFDETDSTDHADDCEIDPGLTEDDGYLGDEDGTLDDSNEDGALDDFNEDGLGEETEDGEWIDDPALDETGDEYLDDETGLYDDPYAETYPEDGADYETQHTIDVNVNGDFGGMGGCSATDPVPFLTCMALLPWVIRRRRRMRS